MGAKSPESDGAGRISGRSKKTTPQRTPFLRKEVPPIAGSVFRGRGGTSVQWELGPLTGELRKRKRKQGPPSCVVRKALLRREVRPSAGSALRGRGRTSMSGKGSFPAGERKTQTKEGRSCGIGGSRRQISAV